MTRAREDCAICIADLNNEATITLECGHCFHGVCLSMWFRRNPACPICRAMPDSESSEESSDETSAMTMRDLTALVSDPLRAARRRNADPTLRRAAAAFRRARDAASAARRDERAHENSEPFGAQLEDMRRLSLVEIERRHAAADHAMTLLRIWERTPGRPQLGHQEPSNSN